ncbi:MAG TPA: hypothetical protein VFE33_27130 [Thermoanaerobaculia bacterium]|nr:hypothetical protein [Thermoanaerobaculia bacterium]
MSIKAGAFASPILMKLARQAIDRLKQAPSDLAWAQEDAAVAIVFSAATIEALVAEFALVCNGMRNTAGTEKQRGSVRLKLLVLKGMLPGVPFDTGKLPFQDIALLIDLRDCLVHLKPVETTDGSHKLLRAAISRGCAASPPAGIEVPWLIQLLTRACAQWAVRVVEEFVECIRADAAKAPFGPSFSLVAAELWGTGVAARTAGNETSG